MKRIYTTRKYGLRNRSPAAIDSANLIENLFSTLNASLAYLNTDCRFVNVNANFARLTGLDPKDLIGQEIFTAFPSAKTDYFEIFCQVLETGKPYFATRTSLHFAATQEPESSYYDWNLQLLRSLDGKPAGLLIIAIDNTDIYRAQQEIQASRTLFEHLFQSDPDANVLVDQRGMIVSLNRQTEANFGYTRDEVLGKSIETLIPDRFRKEHVFLRQLYMQDPYPRPMGIDRQLLGRRKDGTEFPIDVKLSPLITEKGTLILAVIRDISVQRQIETELNEMQHRLIESIEAERLRLAQELHDGPMQDLYAAVYQLQNMEAEMAGRMVQSDLKTVKISLNQAIAILRETCTELRPTSLVNFGLEKAILSHAEKFGSIHPDLKVHLDLMKDGLALNNQVRLALYRIYQHLVSNVARHAKAKNIWIRLMMETGQVILEVEDDGVGFEAPSSFIHLARGGHLGLVGARERAEAIGGRVEIETAPGKGTRVRTTIPQAARVPLMPDPTI